MSRRRAPFAGGTSAARNRGESHIRGAARNAPGPRPGPAARTPAPAATTDAEVGAGRGGDRGRPPGPRGLCGPRRRPRHPGGQEPGRCPRRRRASGAVAAAQRGVGGGSAAAAPGPSGSFRGWSRQDFARG